MSVGLLVLLSNQAKLTVSLLSNVEMPGYSSELSLVKLLSDSCPHKKSAMKKV